MGNAQKLILVLASVFLWLAMDWRWLEAKAEVEMRAGAMGGSRGDSVTNGHGQGMKERMENKGAEGIEHGKRKGEEYRANRAKPATPENPTPGLPGGTRGSSGNTGCSGSKVSKSLSK